MSVKSDLPFGSEFSPSQVDLPTLLALVEEHAGKQAAMQDAIQKKFFSKHGGGNPKNQRTLAMNSRLGLKAYGIIDEKAQLTDFGKQLIALSSDTAAMYAALAKHIMLHLQGMALVQCIRDMVSGGQEVNLTTLREGLAERGVNYPSGGKHPSMMRLWLEKAGVFVGGRWQVDEIRLKKVLGADPDDFAVLAHLSTEQQAFIKALTNTGISSPQPANVITKLATATYGVKFPETSLPKLVLHALVEAGYIKTTKTTEGRGAKPFLVQPTEKLQVDIVLPMLDQLKQRTDPKLLDLLKRPLTDVMAHLDSEDKYKAGLALEALAFHLMRLLAMDYQATRLRGESTGGAEVDLIFHSSRLVYSRWQVQCKNTSRVSLDDVAKEVGLTSFIKSNVIVMVSTGDIGPEARRYANKIMTESNLCIVMLDRTDLNAIRSNPSHVVDAFAREAIHAMQLKKLEL